MTRKQKAILFGIAIGFMLSDGAIIFLSHIPINIPFVYIICIAFHAGFWIGMLEQKWKRDKEMSQIVAERLLRKPEIASNPQQGYAGSGGWVQANPGSNIGGLNTVTCSVGTITIK